MHLEGNIERKVRALIPYERQSTLGNRWSVRRCGDMNRSDFRGVNMRSLFLVVLSVGWLFPGTGDNGASFSKVPSFLIAATVSGTVTNSEGAPVSGATVRFQRFGIIAGSATSNSSGQYSVANLPTGQMYVVYAFLGESSTYSNLTVSGDLTYDIVLPGAVSPGPTPTPQPTATPTPTSTPTPPATPAPTPIPTVTPSPTPAPVPGNCSGVANCVTLDGSTTYQTIDGWEATSEIGQTWCFSTPNHPLPAECPAPWTAYQNTILDAAVDLGINRVRVGIGPSIEHTRDWWQDYTNGVISYNTLKQHWYESVNDNGNPSVTNSNGFKFGKLHTYMDPMVPLRQKLNAQGEDLTIVISYVDYGASSYEPLLNPAEYAELVLATYNHMQNRYGFVPDYWEVVNEPDLTTPHYTGTQIGNAIKAAGDRLIAAGYTPRFIGPSTAGAYCSVSCGYIDQMAQVPGALQYIYEFSYHRYVNADDEGLAIIAAKAASYGKNTSMTEWGGATYNDLHQDLKVTRNVAWEQFTLAFPGADDGYSYLLPTSTSNYVVGSRTKFLCQYFKKVRKGAVRYAASSNNSDLDPLAFQNTDNKHVVIVKSANGGSIRISGLPTGTYGIFYTTNSAFNQQLPNQTIGSGQLLSTSIPATGVITVYAVSGTPSATVAPLRDSMRAKDAHAGAPFADYKYSSTR